MSPALDDPIRLDPFEAGGHPVHTRSLSVDVLQGGHGRVRALATILDLRKQGWIPTGGDLQAAGLIHDMSLDVLVDATSGRIERFEPSQRVVAFEPSGRTAHESCRDPIHQLKGMVGERLAGGNACRLREMFGGPLGCSHLLTLAQLVVSFLPGTIARAVRDVDARQAAWEAGERIAMRTLVIDGFERTDGHQEVALQLTDLHTRPLGSVAGVLERFDAQHEVRAILRVDGATGTIAAFDLAERFRTRADLGTAAWQSRREELRWLRGRPVMRGLAPELLRRYGADAAREPLLAALINFAPGYVQSLSMRVTRQIEEAARAASPVGNMEASGLGGFPDSCYIWRSDGRMTKLRQARQRESG